jgi:hypothetical protein
MIPIVAYYFGASLKLETKDIKKILMCLVSLAFVLALFGIVLYFVDESIWNAIGFNRFWQNKTGLSASYTNFYTFDFGFKLKRCVSVLADPLALAHILGCALVMLFTKNVDSNRCIKYVIFLAFIGTYSKSAYLLIVLSVAINWYLKEKRSVIRWIIVVITFILGAVLISSSASDISNNSSAGIHFSSLMYGLNNMTLFGKGIGNVGYNASLSGLTNYDAAYNESFFATCIGQIGLIGTILLYSFIILQIMNILTKYRASQKIFYRAILIMLFTVMCESLVSASAISMIGTSMYFILSGIAENNENNLP